MPIYTSDGETYEDELSLAHGVQTQEKPITNAPQSAGKEPSKADIESMTHGPEQPNTAQPYLDFFKNFAHGGLQKALSGAGIDTPEWSQKFGDVMSSPEANDAMNITPLGLMKLVPAKFARGTPGKYSILNHEDKDIGYANLTYLPRKKEVHVDMVQTFEPSTKDMESAARQANEHAHAIGLGDMKQLVEAVRNEYPEAQTISGFRISGSRSSRGPAASSTSTRRGSVQTFKIPPFKGERPKIDETDPFNAELKQTALENIEARKREQSSMPASSIENMAQRPLVNSNDEELEAAFRNIFSNTHHSESIHEAPLERPSYSSQHASEIPEFVRNFEEHMAKARKRDNAHSAISMTGAIASLGAQLSNMNPDATDSEILDKLIEFHLGEGMGRKEFKKMLANPTKPMWELFPDKYKKPRNVVIREMPPAQTFE